MSKENFLNLFEECIEDGSIVLSVELRATFPGNEAIISVSIPQNQFYKEFSGGNVDIDPRYLV